MIIRGKDTPNPDVGAMLGRDPMGIHMQWLVSSQSGDEKYRRSIALRRLTSDPGSPKAVMMHYHDYQEAMYVVRGKGRVKTDEEDWTEIGPGDVLYTYPNQPHALEQLGDEVCEIICCIDQSGPSLDPDKNAFLIKYDIWRV